MWHPTPVLFLETTGLILGHTGLGKPVESLLLVATQVGELMLAGLLDLATVVFAAITDIRIDVVLVALVALLQLLDQILDVLLLLLGARLVVAIVVFLGLVVLLLLGLVLLVLAIVVLFSPCCPCRSSPCCPSLSPQSWASSVPAPWIDPHRTLACPWTSRWKLCCCPQRRHSRWTLVHWLVVLEQLALRFRRSQDCCFQAVEDSAAAEDSAVGQEPQC